VSARRQLGGDDEVMTFLAERIGKFDTNVVGYFAEPSISGRVSRPRCEKGRRGLD
jgi:hypothetical protein